MKLLKAIVLLAMGLASNSALAQDYSAKCLIEVASKTNEQAKLTDEKFRKKIENRARRLNDGVFTLVMDSDSRVNNYQAALRKKKDLLDNQLITQAEYDSAVAAKPDLHQITELKDLYPNCGFLSGHSYSIALKFLEPEPTIADEPEESSGDVAVSEGSSYSSSSVSSGGPIRVRSYRRKDGTFVRSHTRSRARR